MQPPGIPADTQPSGNQSMQDIMGSLCSMQAAMLQQQQTLTKQISDMMTFVSSQLPHAPPAHAESSISTPTPTSSKSSDPVPVPALQLPEFPAMPCTSSSPRPLHAAGMPLGTNLKDSIKLKIWNNKYVDFFELLFPDLSNTYSLSFASGSSETPSLQLLPKRKRALTESKWGTAMDTFIAVYTEKYPQDLNSLLTYSHHIKYLMSVKADWQAYDVHFRMDREYSLCSWLTVRQDLELKAFRQSLSMRQPFRQTFSASSRGKVPRGYCFSYHSRGTRCNTPNCPYKHLCPRCSKPHPTYAKCKPQSATSKPTASPPNSSRPPKS